MPAFAAIVDLESLKNMRAATQDPFDALTAKIQDAFKDVPETEIDALVDAAMGAVRPGYRPRVAKGGK